MAPVTTKANFSAPAEVLLCMWQVSGLSFQDKSMSELSLFTLRKRAHSGQRINQKSDPSTSSKESEGSGYPPAFYDNLSKIWLTKEALKGLDRRNTQATASASRTPQKQSSIAVEQGKANYLCSNDPEILKAWERFARHGGPDLSDLRSVR